MKLLDISEVSNQTGVAASAIRHYEEKGLVTSVGRKGLKRLFEPRILDQLSLITLGRAAGFSLDEIGGMFGADGSPSLARQTLHDKADEMDRQIERLSALRDMIRHVADCPAPSHMECPKFQKLVRIGGRKRPAGRSAAPAR